MNINTNQHENTGSGNPSLLDAISSWRIRRIYIHSLCAILVIAGTLAGLTLIQEGSARLLISTGEDAARITDTAGELEIISTREVSIQPERVLQILGGLLIIAATLYAARRIRGYFLRVEADNPVHEDSARS